MRVQSFRHQLRHRTLDAFRIVYETGSATRTAEQLALTQPAISQAIAALERSVGRALFDRGAGRPLVATRDAETIYPAVCRALEAMAEVEAIVEAMRQTGHRRLRVGLVPALAAGFAPAAVARMPSDIDGSDVEFETYAPRALEEAVAVGDADLGLSFRPSVHDDVESAMLFAVDAEVAVAAGHPLARLAIVRPIDLVDEVLIHVRAGAVPRPRIEAAFEAVDAPVRAMIEAPSEVALRDLVAAGRGVGFLTPAPGAAGALAMRPFRPGLSLAVRLLSRRGARPSPLARTFAEVARRLGQEVAAAQAGADPARPDGGMDDRGGPGGSSGPPALADRSARRRVKPSAKPPIFAR